MSLRTDRKCFSKILEIMKLFLTNGIMPKNAYFMRHCAQLGNLENFQVKLLFVFNNPTYQIHSIYGEKNDYLLIKTGFTF